MIISQTVNELYEPLYTTQARYVDLFGGRGRGGSHAGTDYFLHLITKPNYFRGYFLRQTFHDIRDSLFQDFKDRIEDNDTIDPDNFLIKENQMRFEYKPTGNMIISKGVKSDGSRKAKMKSLAGATHILIEECDEVGEEEFDQLDLSLRTIKAKVQIIRIFNSPHKQHWIWRDYVLTDAPKPADYTEKEFQYFTATPKSDSNVCAIFGTYLDNEENIDESTKLKFESYKFKKPEYYYTTIKGLISEGMRGRIFSGWNRITNEEFNSIDARSIFGLDFGEVTGGFIEAKIVKNKLFLREQMYGGGTDKELAIKFSSLGIDQQVIIGDNADPMKIYRLITGWKPEELSAEEMEKYPQMLKGFTVYPAIKAPGSIKFGIDSIKDMEVYATEDSNNLWNEYREYKWALDKNKNPTDEAEDANNHLIDPTRYIVLARGKYF